MSAVQMIRNCTDETPLIVHMGEKTQLVLRTFFILDPYKKILLMSNITCFLCFFFYPNRATEDKMHICRPVICRVTDMLPLPHLMHGKNAQHTILHLNIKPRTNPQAWNSNSAPRFSAFHNFLLLLSFSPIKQSFQLASKRCAALSWGPSKPPVCRQVFRHRESVLFFKDLAHK